MPSTTVDGALLRERMRFSPRSYCLIEVRCMENGESDAYIPRGMLMDLLAQFRFEE
jgi:hypothetical protein